LRQKPNNQNKKTLETMRYEVRKKGRRRTSDQLDAEFKDIASVLKKELSSQMNIGIDPRHVKMIGQLAINRVEKGFKTIEQVVDDIHQFIGGTLDKRQIMDIVSGYGKTSKLSKDEIDVDYREVKRQGRLLAAIDDALAGKNSLRSGLNRDIDSPRIKELKGLLKEAMIKEGFTIDAKKLSDQWDNLNESGSGKKLFANPEDQMISIMDRYRKHLAKREQEITTKLSAGDYETKSRSKTPLDDHMKSAKENVDRLAKEYKKLKEIREKRANPVSNRDAAKIVELSKRVTTNKDNVKDWNDRSPDGPALAYGRSLADFYDYTNNLKMQAEKRTVRETIGEAKAHPLKEAKGAIIKAGNVSKAILSSMDNSALMRQGIKIFWNEFIPINEKGQLRNPFTKENIWLKNAKQSFRDIVHEFGGENVMREVRADVYSRPNALNGRYKQAKIDLGNMEESFPTTLPERIPYLRKPYKASEVAFTGFQYRSRADLADRFFKMAEDMGIKLDEVDPITKKPKQLVSIGMFVNGLTGRGHLGAKLEPMASTLNSVFFSPRFFKSNWDFLTMQMMNDPTPFVRKQAALSLTKYIAGTAVTLAIASAFGAKVETDPRSADFGKIRIGNTRFDITGGVAPLFTFATRMSIAAGSTLTNLIPGVNHKEWGATKSSTTGKIEPLTGVTGILKNGLDLFVNQMVGKLAPIASIGKSLITGMDANRKKLTLGSIIWNATMPIGVQSTKQTLESNDAGGTTGRVPWNWNRNIR
jgi:hypothetical protein